MRFPRRLLFLTLGLVGFGVMGTFWLTAFWRGDAGSPTTGRLYVAGAFPEGTYLLRLVGVPDSSAPRSSCYVVELRGAPADTARVCASVEPRLFWAGDAAIAVAVGADGTPQASVAGVRLGLNDWIGSGADPSLRGTRGPRFPLRGYGIPSAAAQVVACPSAPVAGPPVKRACIRVEDRLGRLALARLGGWLPGGDVRLRNGAVYELRHGDELWLGLVPFRVQLAASRGETRLVLSRIQSARSSGRRGSPADFTGRGGDRRWLGRLWPVEDRDPGPAPATFVVEPMTARYSRHNLSRQRSNLELEDVLQRLVDGQWLCLVGGGDSLRVSWRPLASPGCGPQQGSSGSVPYSRQEADDYRKGRDRAALIASLVEQTNRLLAERRHVQDPSVLPLAFEWGLRRSALPPHSIEPVPLHLWGTRFGTTRVAQPRNDAASAPTLALRTSTSRHLLQVVLPSDSVLATFFVPASLPAQPGSPGGSICIETSGSGGRLLTSRDGGEYPLGTIHLRGGAPQLLWSAAGTAGCGGCRLSATATDRDTVLTLASSGPSPDPCHGFSGTGRSQSAWKLRPGETLDWRGAATLRLRYLRRHSSPWMALTDPLTGGRRFAEEFHRAGGLEPLVGEPGAPWGLDRVVTSRAAHAVGGVPARDIEVSIDGDLQLAAAAVVDAVAGSSIREVPPSRAHEAQVTAVILDTWSGEVLSAVSWSKNASTLHGARPNAWELGSGQAGSMVNAAFLREAAIGSTMKIVGVYALANNGTRAGPEVAEGAGLSESDPSGRRPHGALHLARIGGNGREGGLSGQTCSTGPHVIPASDDGFTSGTVVRRFAKSCNNFFVLTGFRYAGGAPAPRSRAGVSPGVLANGLMIRRDPRNGLILTQPKTPFLADRIREGLAEDAARPSSAPRSLYGLLFRLGFQPQPDTGEVGFASLGFDHAGARVSVPLNAGWFRAVTGQGLGLDGGEFSYPSVPSPGQMDETTLHGPPVQELYDGQPRPVKRDGGMGERADGQYAMLMIGQSTLRASALALAVLYAPAAREDGHAVSPCIFRLDCDPDRAGGRVLETGPGSGAWLVNEALHAVVDGDGTAAGKLRRADLAWLNQSWGGKTGTYEQEVRAWPRAQLGPSSDWDDLVAYACGVQGIASPAVAGIAAWASARSPALGNALLRMAALPPGAALGARTCESSSRSLNPGGIHAYRDSPEARALDATAEMIRRLEASTTQNFHAFVMVSLPQRAGSRWPSRAGPGEGIVVAVLVDHEKDIAVEIGARLAAVAERWATTAPRVRPSSARTP